MSLGIITRSVGELGLTTLTGMGPIVGRARKLARRRDSRQEISVYQEGTTVTDWDSRAEEDLPGRSAQKDKGRWLDLGAR